MSGSSRSVAVSTDARICSRGLKATVAVALAASAAQVIDLAVLDPGSRLLDMNTHASLFGVVSLLALAAACGAGLLLVTYPAANGRARIVLPLLLAALLGLRLLHPAGVIFYAIPLVAVTFPVLWWHVATPGSDAQRVIRIGCVALAGSYLVRSLGDVVAGPGHHDERWAQQARLLVGHAGELAGWMAVATGLAAAFVLSRQSDRVSR